MRIKQTKPPGIKNGVYFYNTHGNKTLTDGREKEYFPVIYSTNNTIVYLSRNGRLVSTTGLRAESVTRGELAAPSCSRDPQAPQPWTVCDNQNNPQLGPMVYRLNLETNGQ